MMMILDPCKTCLRLADGAHERGPNMKETVSGNLLFLASKKCCFLDTYVVVSQCFACSKTIYIDKYIYIYI